MIITYKEVDLFVDHKKCPKCVTKVRRSDLSCRSCGHSDLTNWPLTLTMWALGLAIIIAVTLFVFSNFCGAPMFQPLITSYGVMC